MPKVRLSDGRICYLLGDVAGSNVKVQSIQLDDNDVESPGPSFFWPRDKMEPWGEGEPESVVVIIPAIDRLEELRRYEKVMEAADDITYVNYFDFKRTLIQEAILDAKRIWGL